MGTYPVENDLLKRMVRKGASSSAKSLTSHVGTGSNPQDLLGEFLINLFRSSTVIDEK
jgi:hypothetical protein